MGNNARTISIGNCVSRRLTLIIPVILSGGSGTRLWPVSRESHPKPFIRLSDGQSLLQKTISRISKRNDISEILTITNRDFYFKTKDEYLTLQHHSVKNCFLLEPFGRNTAPAIGLAALYALEKYGPESILLILPADHLIEQQDVFDNVIDQAYQAAKENKIVTFGITPTSPETCYGYIKFDKSHYKNGTFQVNKFVEKPPKELAAQYLSSGEYLWNSGMFCFKADVIINQIEKCSPDIFSAISHAWQSSQKHRFLTDAIEIDADTFDKADNISIDYAIMEKTQDAVVVACDFTWSDIGCWSAISGLSQADEMGNRIKGDAVVIDTTNSFIQSSDRMLTVLGLDNIIVVDTPDALLVANSERSQDVKKIVDQLKKNNHDSYKLHRTIFRPWGSYTILETSKNFKIKRIVVKPKSMISLQMHHHRSEHWTVVSGIAKVTNNSNTFILNTNESTFVPVGSHHRVENPGLLDLVIIEVQTGEYLGEDDIVRFDDKYGRETLKIESEKQPVL